MTKIRSAIIVGILAVVLLGADQTASISASGDKRTRRDRLREDMRYFIVNSFGPGRSVTQTEQPDTSPYGINTWHTSDYLCEQITDLGTKWVRLQPRWQWIESTEGQFTWETDMWGGAGRLDSLVNTMSARGFKVTISVAGPPEWARKGGDGLPIPEKMAAFCTALAQRYDGKIACYEILAEENTLATNYRDKQASTYVPILRACYQAIKAVNPKNLVACCGQWGPYGDTTYMTYMGDLYRAGAKNYFDVANIHFYPGASTNEELTSLLKLGLAHLRWVMTRYGDEKKPLWITEFGFAVPNDSQNNGTYTEAEQATYLRDTLDVCRESGIVSKVFWYQLRNDDGMALIQTDFKGAEGSDDHKRLVYFAYKSYIAQYPTWPSKAVAKPWQVDRASAISLTNAGFENGISGWAGNVERDVTRAHSGLSSGKINIEGKGTGAFQIVELEGAGSYMLSGYLRTDPNVGARMAVTFTKDNTQEVLRHWNTNTVIEPGGTDTWQMIQIAVIAPAGSKKAVVYIWARSGQGNVWYDDVELVPYHEAPITRNYARD